MRNESGEKRMRSDVESDETSILRKYGGNKEEEMRHVCLFEWGINGVSMAAYECF